VDNLLSIGLSNAVAAALLALVAIAAGAICRRPALIHGLWLLVLLKLVTPPLVRIPIAWPTNSDPTSLSVAAAVDESSPAVVPSAVEQTPPIPPEAPVAFLVVEEEASAPLEAAFAPPPMAPPDEPLWPRLLSVAWLTGSLGWFALALARLQRFHRLLRYSQPASLLLQERTQRLSRRLGMYRCPRVGLLPGRLAPMLWAIGGSPRLLLPADLPRLLSEEQLDTLLVHELAHLRRRDHWVRALEFVVMGLYWWHPIVWYARRELREAEEQCCDAWVVSTLPAAGRTYASALMDTLDFLATTPSAVPPLASGLSHVSNLKRRLTMIMCGTTPRALSWPGYLAVLAFGVFFLPLLPALHAQAPSKEKSEKRAILILGDDSDNKADLARAKAKLAQMEAQLQQKMADVAKAKAELEAAAKQVRLGEQNLERPHQPRMVLRLDKAVITAGPEHKPGKVEEGNKKAIRIEVVVGPDVKADNLKDLLKKLESIASEKQGCVIVIRREAAASPKPAAGFRIVPVTPEGIRFSLPVTIREKPAPTNAPPEKRLNDLEKKLEKLLQEMQELRKEMKTRPGVKLDLDKRPGVLYDKLDSPR